MSQQQHVLSWLKDAHAMEQGGILTLENHAAAAQGYPEVQAKLHGHVEATRRHADLVEKCIERLGGRPSALKEVIGTVIGKVQGVANLPAQDVVIKNALGELAAENFEIASYTSLIAAAEQTGDYETASVCRQILYDEEEMAEWLTKQIPIITRQFLVEQTGEEGQGVQTRVADRAKQTLEEFGEQGKELASQAKKKGKEALIVSGALLAGAGAGLLIVQALRSGSDEKRQTQEHNGDKDGTKTAYSNVRAGYDDVDIGEGREGLGVEPLTAFNSQVESLDSLDLGEPSMQDAEFFTGLETQAEGRLGDVAGQISESPVFQSLQSQDQTVDNSSSADADLIGTELISSDVQDVDELLSPDVDSPDTELLADDVQSDVQGASALAYTEVWLVPGPYSGIGPTGYDSSGDPTGQEIYSRLVQHGQVDASNIEIVIDNGEVLLEGTVDSEKTKRLVEESVITVTGVNSVQNLLRVQASQDS